jgi:hypothetical protein
MDFKYIFVVVVVAAAAAAVVEFRSANFTAGYLLVSEQT